MNQPAVFFDKDGTLIKNVPYNTDPALVRLNAGARECLHLLRDGGFRLFVISNQSGIAQGFFSQEDLAAAWAWIEGLSGVKFDGCYFCPHEPATHVTSVACTCRKPSPGLLYKAASEHGIDLAASWLVGDILDDIEAGRRAGLRTVLLNNGNETEWVYGQLRVPHFIVENLTDAARIIMKNSCVAAQELLTGPGSDLAPHAPT
jgi:D-glycero-D-manno-heptose 1,7-bisphosphate phosphatase